MRDFSVPAQHATGRNDATGHALTLAEPSERPFLADIEHAFGLKLLTDDGRAERSEAERAKRA